MPNPKNFSQLFLEGEKLLFYCEKAEVKGRQGTVIITGPLLITDKRLLMMGPVPAGILSRRPAVLFQAVYDSDYARQIQNDIVTGASPQKTTFGSEYLLLNKHAIVSPTGILKIATYGAIDWNKSAWELRLKSPLVLAMTEVADTDEAASAWFASLVANARGRADLGYKLILEIVGMKSPEMLELVGRLEIGVKTGEVEQVNPMPSGAATPLASAPLPNAAPIGSWLGGYLEPGEHVRFEDADASLAKSMGFANINCEVVLTDRRILLHSEQGRLPKGQKTLVQRLSDITDAKYHEAGLPGMRPIIPMGFVRILGPSTKMEIIGKSAQMKKLCELVGNKPETTGRSPEQY